MSGMTLRENGSDSNLVELHVKKRDPRGLSLIPAAPTVARGVTSSQKEDGSNQLMARNLRFMTLNLILYLMGS